jgi:hypothetical protein
VTAVRDDDKLSPEALTILAYSRVVDLKDATDEVASIADRVSRPMQTVHSVNSDMREIAFAHWMLAEKARADIRTLLRIGWGIDAAVAERPPSDNPIKLGAQGGNRGK